MQASLNSWLQQGFEKPGPGPGPAAKAANQPQALFTEFAACDAWRAESFCLVGLHLSPSSVVFLLTLLGDPTKIFAKLNSGAPGAAANSEHILFPWWRSGGHSTHLLGV